MSGKLTKRSQLGIYQCVLSVTDADDRNPQWDSYSAILHMVNEEIVALPRGLSIEQTTPQLTPMARPMPSQLAAYVSWKPADRLVMEAIHSSGLQKPSVRYVLQISTQNENSSIPEALDGLLSAQHMDWTDAMDVPLQAKRNDTLGVHYIYLQDSILKPGRQYRLRVESGGGIHVTWTYAGDGSDQDPFQDPFQVSGRKRGPILVPDEFVILVRPVKNSNTQGGKIEYGPYRQLRVRGSSKRSGTVQNLNSTSNYQVLVYATKGEGESRMITLFSSPMHANLLVSNEFRLFEFFNNNRMLYLIVAASMGALLLFISILILLFGCRQRRQHNARNRSLRGSKAAGYPYLYNDVSKAAQNVGMGGMGQGGPPPTAVVNPSVSGPQAMSPEQQAQLQADQYAASIHQARMMAAAASGYGPQNPNGMGHLPHHQSHQSLLLASQQGSLPNGILTSPMVRYTTRYIQFQS
ncbi:hypothetical protein Ciccas_000838 [Cichlidogyrus casuarinus]|uniref:Uncharacterized protein n=1 Tax=Cichlidogyrus casuarinus TaxID=1844966 RepID=A0ABD2QLS0_9PLAT